MAKVGRAAGSDDDDQRSEKAVLGKKDDMKSLLEEAGKMLRNMSGSSTGEGKDEEGEHDLKIRSLQKQLNDLRATSLRVLRLSRGRADASCGLLDSGATHALRLQYPGEVVEGYKAVKVSLAGNKEVSMKMFPANTWATRMSNRLSPWVPLSRILDARCSGLEIIW